jgi:hypothetical protein
MHDLYVFVAAIIFVIVALPILQTISDIFVTFGQWIISVFNVKTTKNNVEIQDLNDSVQPTSAQAIGFQAPFEEDYYDEEEEPDNKNKRKVGF